MNHAACLLALTLVVTSSVVASSAFAQASSSSDAPHFAPAPPPPGMNDPGVHPGKKPATSSIRSKAASSPLPGQPTSTPDAAPRDMNGQTPPDVSLRQEGDNTIQEYRQNGRVYKVVVTPKHGPQQVYDVDQNSYMFDPVTRMPIRPVEYKVLEWGNSKPASASSAQDNGR